MQINKHATIRDVSLYSANPKTQTQHTNTIALTQAIAAYCKNINTQCPTVSINFENKPMYTSRQRLTHGV